MANPYTTWARKKRRDEGDSDNPYIQWALNSIRGDKNSGKPSTWIWGDDSELGHEISPEQDKAEIDKNLLAVQIAEQAAEEKKKKEAEDEAKRIQIEEEARRKSGPEYSNYFERLGDSGIFGLFGEANSPQDKAKREYKGQPTLYQDQQNQRKEVETRANNLDLAKDEIDERRDFYARNGINLDFLINDKDKYNELKGKSKSEIIELTKSDDPILSFGKDYEEQKKKLKKVEEAFQNSGKVARGEDSSIPQQAVRGFTRGVSWLADLPSNAQSFGANALDVVAPEGSRLDKYAQERYDDVAKDNAKIQQHKIDYGAGQGPDDNKIVMGLSEGAGSLATSMVLGGGPQLADDATKAVAPLWKRFVKGLNPKGVGALFGINEAGEITRDARDSGASDLKALMTSATSGYMEAILENWGLGNLLKAEGKVAANIFKQGLIEGSQEFMQDISTSGVQATYKDVDWGKELAQALEAGAYGGVLGGGASIGTTLSNNLQRQNVPPEDADYIGQQFEESMKDKTKLRAEEAGVPVEEAPPEAPVDDGVNVNPPESGPVDIPGVGVDVPDQTEQEIKQQLDEAGVPDPLPKNPDGTTKIPDTNIVNPPKVQPTESADDWETNYADHYQSLQDEIDALDAKIKETPKRDQPPLKMQRDELVAQQAAMEESFVKKWKGKDAADDAIGQEQKPVKAKSKDPLASTPEVINKERLGESEASDNQYRKASYEEAKTMTDDDAVEVAKNAIRKYVERGDSIGDLKSGQGGGTSKGGHQSIGGYINGKRISTDYMVVELDDGRVYKYKLKDIYDSVAAEKPDEQETNRLERKANIKELAKAWVGRKWNEGLNVDLLIEEDNRTDKTAEGVKQIKQVTDYKDIKVENKGGVNVYRRPQVIVEIVDAPKPKGTPKKLGKPDASIKYPETKDLPETLKENMPGVETMTIKTVSGREVTVRRGDERGPALPKMLLREAIVEAKAKGDVEKARELKLINPESLTDVEVKDLKTYVFGDKQIEPNWQPNPKPTDKLTPVETREVAGADQSLKKSDLATIVRLVPGLKDNPVFTVTKFDGDLAITYKSSDNRQTGTIKLNKIGISNERAESIGLKEGMTVDLSEVLNTKAKGRVPVIRNNKTGQEASTERKSGDRFDSEVARTPEELEAKLDQINWFGQKNAILRRGQLKSKKNAGVFQHPRKKGTDSRGVIKLRDDVIKTPEKYLSVLSHETAHAIENYVTGSNGKTYDVFGKLTKEERSTIEAELKAIVVDLEGQEVVDSDPSYYNKPTEMWARLVETLILKPSVAEKLAPTALAKLEDQSVTDPAIFEFVQVLQDKIAEDRKPKVWSAWRDLRQTYQRRLGKSLGNIAYNAELTKRAELQMWQASVKEAMDKKFKGVKDDQSLLFRVGESIKEMDGDGNIVFGTRDYHTAETPADVDRLTKAGFELDQIIITPDGKKIAQMSRVRYTEEQGKQLYEQLTPKGKALIQEFVKDKKDAQDLFNRELMKEVFKIDGAVEGWVHHGLQEERKGGLGGKANQLRKRKAGMSKKRTSLESKPLENFRKQVEKALLDAGQVEINNRFIEEQMARISKPIAKGQDPDKGWTEVIWDPKKGMMLVGEGGRERVFVDKTDEWGDNIQFSFLKPQNRYQVPTDLVNYYRNMRTVTEEVTATQRIVKALSKYWAINVLAHAGTAGTNFVGGGIQYSTKILDDFYSELLSGSVTMPKTRRDIAALIQVLMPKNWKGAPTYVYGGNHSTFAGQFMETAKSEKIIEKYGDYALLPFATIENYYKKAIMIAENKGGFRAPELGRQMQELSKAEKEMLGIVNQKIDISAYDYDNVPFWMMTAAKKGGLIKPFIKYPYKYMKMVTHYATGAFDRSLPANERAAKLLTLTTIMAAILALQNWREKEQETPEGSDKTPSSLDPRGRLMAWKNGAEELFVRTAKYPFFNITSIGKAIVEKDWGTVGDITADQLGTVGPVAKAIMISLGYTNEFEKYTPKDALYAQQLATFIPGFRILNDVGKILDDKPRLPKNFTQGIFSTLPVWGDEETKTRLRGDAKVLRVPIEPETRNMSKSETTERELQIFKQDVLLSALTGVYITRIRPDEAQAQAIREYRNSEEEAIRELLKKHKFTEARQRAYDAGMTISKDSVDYYRRNYSSDGTKIE